MKRKPKLCLTIKLFPVVFIAIGLLVALISYSQLRQYNAAESVTGIVARSKRDIYTDTDNNTNVHYDIYVNYEYKNKTYTNIYLCTEEYPVSPDTSITFKVNPDNPDTPISEPMYIPMILGVLFIIAGCFVAYKLFFPLNSDAEAREDYDDFYEEKEEKSKKRYLFLFIPLIPTIVFLLLGIYISPFFHIGTIIFSYFTAVVFDFVR